MFLLEYIDPNNKRTDGWMQVAAFLKFKCGEEADYPIFEDAFDVFDQWSEPGVTYTNTDDTMKFYLSLTEA